MIQFYQPRIKNIEACRWYPESFVPSETFKPVLVKKEDGSWWLKEDGMHVPLQEGDYIVNDLWGYERMSPVYFEELYAPLT